MTERRGRFPIGATIAMLVALAALVGLGLWQLQRLTWKTDLLARIAALQGAPATLLGPALDSAADGANLQFRRVVVDCPGLAQAPFLELYGLREGGAGSRLISACKVDAARYRTILVDRGFVADTISARPPVDGAATAPVRMVGVLRLPDKATFVTPPNDVAANRWFSRDVAAMAKALDAPAPAPLFLMAETSSNPEWKALTPAPIPTEIPNRHFEYALTWFGLAGSLLAVYAAMLWRRWKS
ncbi:SURF1 family protein [Phenylobacterium sp.]|uniref:SURF1 family protein n=1 Tax=Phenylobacterium sp. TaxID=1871053 RepID=UPI0027365910|nr:SURF1 family cytochrome oxidase biogenesis protein [Phenylobacterium sp.]MDP3658850.1 SURF1 family cytochrome oxidase biogenesis protein [Phenylobacterium sp.]